MIRSFDFGPVRHFQAAIAWRFIGRVILVEGPVGHGLAYRVLGLSTLEKSVKSDP